MNRKDLAEMRWRLEEIMFISEREYEPVYDEALGEPLWIKCHWGSVHTHAGCSSGKTIFPSGYWPRPDSGCSSGKTIFPLGVWPRPDRALITAPATCAAKLPLQPQYPDWLDDLTKVAYPHMLGFVRLLGSVCT
jgi:hypothetical protein